jgi:hypothetical protein
MGLPGLALLIIATQAMRARFGSSVVVRMQPDAPVEIAQKTVCLFIERATGKPLGGFADGAFTCVLRVELFAPVEAEVSSSSIAQMLQGSSALWFMWREIEAALAPSAGPWGVLWEQFRLDLDGEMFSMPLFETKKGVKVAAQVVGLTVSALTSPPFGEPTQAWADLLTQMRATGGELSSVADLIETAVRGGMSGFPALAATLGVSNKTLAALGLGSIADDGSTPTPMDHATLEDPSGNEPTVTIQAGVATPMEPF